MYSLNNFDFFFFNALQQLSLLTNNEFWAYLLSQNKLESFKEFYSILRLPISFSASADLSERRVVSDVEW